MRKLTGLPLNPHLDHIQFDSSISDIAFQVFMESFCFVGIELMCVVAKKEYDIFN